MDPMNAAMAMGSLSLASADAMNQYSMAMQKKSMDEEMQAAQNLLEMLPQQPSFQVRGPQPGQIPEIQKGNVFDIYA